MNKVDRLELALILIEKAEYVFKLSYLTYPIISKSEIAGTIRGANADVRDELGFFKSFRNASLLSHIEEILTEYLSDIHERYSLPNKVYLCLYLRQFSVALFRSLDIQAYEYQDGVKIYGAYKMILYKFSQTTEYALKYYDEKDIYIFRKEHEAAAHSLWDHYKKIVDKGSP